MILISSKAFSLGVVNQNSNRTSIIQLISTPEKFDGKIVRVIGAVNFEFEGNQLCLHKEDLENSISENCLWLEVENNSLQTNYLGLTGYNGTYIILEGIFRKNKKGHMNLFSGSIESINRLDSWNFPRKKK